MLHTITHRYQEAEKMNGRWAMMAVAGILGQELLGVTPKWCVVCAGWQGQVGDRARSSHGGTP